MKHLSAVEILKNLSLNEETTLASRTEIAPYRSIQQSVPANAKTAAVLLHIYPFENQAHFALIERPVYNGAHSGQIALPGGQKEDSDLDLFDTAKREAFEEVNIVPDEVEILHSLTELYIPPSNFHVQPILSIGKVTPNFQKEEKEVADIIQVSLHDLIHCDIKKTEIKLPNNLLFETPYLHLNNKVVWGATALILNELRLHLQK